MFVSMYPNNVIRVETERQLKFVLDNWLTVHAIQDKYGRSRSWAYHQMNRVAVYEVQWSDGAKICRVVSKKAFAEHVKHLRRPGNPNWG